ncbi:Ig-like domain-containing protein [Arthrobacter sp. zg-Y40]|uniref:L,D-transpeptidase n=1 Tax=unclassified Arthrobacter TaxID=235627 RepID=UPI001D147FCC|nr:MULTISPECIES: Ig-like domain-containing protein [unclassified Arthrobacter]MCC3278740.1 Ig-like domain-containing protein [Arthrobacter sp. zg-Y40]MCC3275662.1 Ig-like domain-containing protein [Arthrobacter sp. zg-Y20]MDK1315819.1 Ig-like domain-containing protein [Arthrobacter sp. zg.Y20]MDK1326186.1 Ig-like domain-containing protein [Arthrobacter sp. zg-Y1143]WIB06220.1 Ig-like domain-containing protein [Arthrobacter sp. zg-Y20]
MQDKKSRKWVIAAAVAGVLVVGGGIGAAYANGVFDPSADESSPAAESPASPSASAAPVSITATPADGAVAVNPATAATVTATNAEIESVSLKPAAGGPAIPGVLSGDNTVWTADAQLAFDTTYAMDVVLTDQAGKETTRSQSFETVKPANEANAFMYPQNAADVGVGQPIEINFSEPVTNKAAVEQAIKVSSTSGQAGAFYWITDNKVRYRPEAFWAPNSSITVDMQLFGVDFGNGMIGNFNETRTFTTHNTRLAVVDNFTKTMQVFIDGQLVRTFPVTLGEPTWPSPSGYQVVVSQHEKLPFRAESIGLKPGDPDYYEPFDASWASRLTNSGVFVHQALNGAVGALGRINVSHGCVGMSAEGAKYFYDTFDAGDVVQVLNTEAGPVSIDDGYGDWNIPWDQYAGQP